MDLEKWYRKKSLELFADMLEPYFHYFESLKPDLRKADIKLSLREYICMAVMAITLVFSIETPLLAFIVGLLPRFTIPMAILFSLTVSLVMAGGITFFFYIHPSLKASSRGEDIDHGIPFAATYLSTIAGSGIHPSGMFEILSGFEDYETIAEEAGKISANVELFGMTIIEAMAKAAKETPSKRFKELLWGMITAIRSGVDLEEYLHERSRELMKQYRRDISEYSDTLATFLQMYLTLIIVGSIFSIIVTSIMSSFGMAGEMGGMIAILHFSIVFIFLPVITIGFVWMLKTTYPGE
ncbi:MAG: type II secretion system F family protein [Candidatus Aenigmatarchaeota archaeon]